MPRMPKSKSKRQRYQPPPKPKPPPSPKWVPVLFFICIGLGFVVILGRYALSGVVGIFDKDYMLWVGLGLIAAAFGVATQWR
jgi:cell division protein CrgA